jgi:hypothetical protein
MYPSAGMGDTGSSGTRWAASSVAVMNPWLTRSLEGKEKQCPISATTFSPVSRSISLHLFLFRCREGDEEATGVCARGRRFAQEWAPTYSIITLDLQLEKRT